MKLYLLRHGKTDAHLQNKRQSPDTPLGEVGREQAKSAGEKIAKLSPEILLTSEWPRAVQTAEIISKVIGIPYITMPNLHEQLKAKSLDDIADDSEINQKFLKERLESSDNLDFDWRFENEGESTNDLIARAKEVLNEITTKYSGKDVVVVSHGNFLATLITVVIFGTEADKKSVISFIKTLKYHNAGISTLEYDESTGQWSLLGLNDHSHLYF